MILNTFTAKVISMSLQLPSGRILIRNQTAESCSEFLRERFHSVRKGEVSLNTVEVGRVDGRIHHDGRFTMGYRLAHLVHSGTLVIVGTIKNVTEGCEISYRTRIQRVTLTFWIVWIAALLAVIMLSLGTPDSASTSRIMLSTVIILLVPILVGMSLKRGRQEIKTVVTELVSWFGDDVILHRTE